MFDSLLIFSFSFGTLGIKFQAESHFPSESIVPLTSGISRLDDNSNDILHRFCAKKMFYETFLLGKPVGSPLCPSYRKFHGDV